MAEAFLGEIRPYAFPFAPRNWALCTGQSMSISQNQALFSLLGTTFGGNGTTTFFLPNLQGRHANGQGQGSGLSSYTMGQSAGSETVSLIVSQIPTHTHLYPASNVAGTSASPNGTVPAVAGDNVYGLPATTPMSPGVIQNVGAGQPHLNMAPYLAINYSIALVGIFPSRN